MISEPGLYLDVPEHVYHADPVEGGSLSSTGCRRILETCPAEFAWEREHGRPTTADLDFGRLAHALLLGVGQPVARIRARDWRTREAKAEIANAEAEGLMPVKADDYDRAVAMVSAVRAHPVAGALFAPGTGRPEASMVWRDPATGVMCRGRVDWLRDQTDGPLIIVDYKTTRSLDVSSLEKSIYEYGYHQQAPWYQAGVRALGLSDAPGFLFVFQKKTAPYQVRVVQLPDTTVGVGERRNERALRLYAECQASGVWPGYSDGLDTIGIPVWAEKQEADR